MPDKDKAADQTGQSVPTSSSSWLAFVKGNGLPQWISAFAACVAVGYAIGTYRSWAHNELLKRKSDIASATLLSVYKATGCFADKVRDHRPTYDTETSEQRIYYRINDVLIQLGACEQSIDEMRTQGEIAAQTLDESVARPIEVFHDFLSNTELKMDRWRQEFGKSRTDAAFSVPQNERDIPEKFLGIISAEADVSSSDDGVDIDVCGLKKSSEIRTVPIKVARLVQSAVVHYLKLEEYSPTAPAPRC